ncbi:BCCT family transporter [Nocardioides sp. ChNu-99]|uniref:BCCT family transporter n=1 Tax=Nocardioides sp. ChNu-99 TaxID=2839897 RepID=UPI00240696CC|nr:BCCT family transporter [Nocardioides sp. ChNu-99]MDF9716114.1 BCCT family transporter [Nocardioides sp. ChNu-99]
MTVLDPKSPADDAEAQHEPTAEPSTETGSHPALDVSPPVERRPATAALDPWVFGVTAVFALAFLLWGFLGTDSLSSASSQALTWIVEHLGWLFVLASSGFVVFVLWLALSRYGSIPLGRDDEEPEFRTISWIAMMFSAGMGIGLMFYGVSEPVSHFTTGPPGTGEAGDQKTALATTLFHWGLHPWAIYAVLGLAVAYGVYRKGRVQLVSAAFEAILGRRAHGPIGKVIDILAIFATLFGSAASLGLGALQISSGLEIVAGVGEVGNVVLVAIIAGLTAAFVVSAVSGVARGIQWLSNINMVLALALALFVFVVGPTVFILDMVPSALASYGGDLAEMAGRVPSDTETASDGSTAASWLSGWTIFYWAWWLSWTPFVGLFIARISRGRTIRQFVAGVLLVPTAVSLVWFAIFGGAAIHLQEMGRDIAGAAGLEDQLFTVLDAYPLAWLTGFVVMVLVGIFFISGADAASIVMGQLSERGASEPRRWTVVFWGCSTGAVAAVMLLVGGSDALQGLQNITIAASVPFVLVMIGLCFALVKDLRTDPVVVRRQYAVQAVEQAVLAGVTEHGDDFVLSYEGTEPGEGLGDYMANGHPASATAEPDAVTAAPGSTGIAGAPPVDRTPYPCRHQPAGSGRPSWKPAADCTPTTARSCSSAIERAPA